MDQRDMRHAGNAPAERIVNLLLACRVDQMIVAANDVGYSHVVVVNDHSQHVSRITVAAQQYKIVEVFILPHHPTLNLILDDGLAGLGGAEPDCWFHAGWGRRWVPVAPHPVVKARAAFGARLFAHYCEFLSRCVAAIGLAAGEQGLRNLAMARGTTILVDDLAVPIELKPFEAVEDCRDRRLRRPLPVGVLDAQEHLATAAAREEPVEQRCARPSDMEEASRRGSKACDNIVGHGYTANKGRGGCIAATWYN